MPSTRLLRVIGAVVLLLSMFVPRAAPAAGAQESTGSLSVALLDDSGAPLGGGCFDVSDATDSTQSICDDDGDGTASLSDFPVGDVTVTQTSGPDGYGLAAPGATTISAGTAAAVQLTATALPVETPTSEPGTPAPTEEPTETATAEPTEIVTPEPGTPEPVEPSPTVGTEIVTEAATPSSDATPEAASEEISLAAERQRFGVTFSLFTGPGLTAPIPNGSVLPLNSFVQIQPNVITSGPIATGTYRLLFYFTPDCSDTPISIPATVYSSGQVSPVNTGFSNPTTFNLVFSYDGDANYLPLTTQCGDAVVSFGNTLGPGHAVTLTRTDTNATVPPGAAIPFGTPIKISDALTNLKPAATSGFGHLSSKLVAGSDCSGATVRAASVEIQSLSGPGSATAVIEWPGDLPPGQYSISNYYYDPTKANTPSVSGCVNAFTVGKYATWINLTLSKTVLSTTESVIGSATLAGGVNPTGSVSYYVYQDSQCVAPILPVLGPYPLTNGQAPQSESFQFNGPGPFGWIARYSGDDNNQPASSSCMPLTVRPPLLSLVLTAADADIDSGESLSYTLTLTNTGPGDAFQPAFSDQLPAGFTWSVTSKSPSLNCGAIDANRTLLCSMNRLDSSAAVTVTVTGVSLKAVCGSFDNSGSASATNFSATPSNTIGVTVRCGDLELTKVVSPATSAPGMTLEFKIEATNRGDAALTDVLVTDNLTVVPGIAWSVNTATSTSGCAVTTGILRCNWGTLGAGGHSTVYVRGMLTTGSCGVWTNVANSRASNELVIKAGNNTALADATVLCTDVAVTKTPVQAVVAAGDDVGFSLIASNPSGLTAENVVLTDTLPAGLTWRFNDPSCSITGSALRCTLGSILPGQSRTVTIAATTSTSFCGSIPNTASVTAKDEDPAKLGNNSSNASVKVGCPDLQVTKAPVLSPVAAGSNLTFTITVANIGDGAAKAVNVIDGLPYGIEWTTQTAGCFVLGGTLGCQFTSIGPGESRTITVSGRATTSTCGPIGSYVFAWSSNERNELILNNIVYGEATVRCS